MKFRSADAMTFVCTQTNNEIFEDIGQCCPCSHTSPFSFISRKDALVLAGCVFGINKRPNKLFLPYFYIQHSCGSIICDFKNMLKCMTSCDWQTHCGVITDLTNDVVSSNVIIYQSFTTTVLS